MSTRDLLRTFIIKTNPYWPFSWANRIPYTLAVRSLKQAFGKCPEVRSMWVWHDQWVPALSDIDLSVVIQRGLTTEQEYAFLEFFWKTFDRLRRFYPMLEAKLLSEDELPTWLSYANSGHPDMSPVFLHGVEDPALAEVRSPKWRQFAVSFSLWVYMDVLPPCFALPDSFLRRQDIQRRVRKILRLLNPVLAEAGQSCEVFEPTGVADALLALESAVAHLSSIAPRDVAEPSLPQEDTGGREDSPAGIPAWDGVRSAIRTSTGKILIIAEDGLDRIALDRIIEASRRHWSGEAHAPVVLSHRVFAYLIRSDSPYYYSQLVFKRIILFGTDPLAEVPPPGTGALAAYIRSRIAHILTFTRSDTVFSRSAPLPVGDWGSTLDQALALKMLLRDDWVTPRRREITGHWRSEFPQCAAAFDKVKGDAAEGRDQAACEGFFHLFRPIAREILDQVGSGECGGA